MTQKNDLLIYTIETIIDKGSSRVTNLTLLGVNKLAYLTYIELKKTGIDIRLPYSWYRYGAMIETRGFERMTQKRLDSYFCDIDAVTINPKTPTPTLTDTQKEQIDNVTDNLLNTFTHNTELNISKLIWEVYEHAPYDFQRNYKRTLTKTAIETKTEEELTTILNTLKNTFPKEKYEDTYPLYLRFDDTMRLGLTTKAKRTELNELREALWIFFASQLRTRENENLTPKEITETIANADAKRHDLSRTLNKFREKYLQNLDIFDLADLSDNGQNLLKEISTIAYKASVQKSE